MKSKLPKIVVIFAPTASGKSDLAIRIAQEKNGEIVSADSRQIYRGMDIGTAKEPLDKNQAGFEPDREIKYFYYGLVRKIPHYMIDIVDPNEAYTLANYQKDAAKVIDNILERKRLPILVGGTGLYIQAIAQNLKIPKAKPDLKLRRKLNDKDIKELAEIYYKLDPDGFKDIDLNNKRRLIRAIEVTKLTNIPYSRQVKKNKPKYNIEMIDIGMDRAKLYEIINQRVDDMVDGGLINEVKNLIKKYPQNLPAFTGIGYKEFIEYLNKAIAKEEAIELIKRNSRRYAKRQMTWMKREE